MLDGMVRGHLEFCQQDPDRSRFVYALFFGPLGSGPGRRDHQVRRTSSTASWDRLVDRLVAAGLIDPDRARCASSKRCAGSIVIHTMDHLYRGENLDAELPCQLVRDLHQGLRNARTGPEMNAMRGAWRVRSSSLTTGFPRWHFWLGLIAPGCTNAPEATGEARADEIRSIPVTVAAAELRPVERTIPVTGTLKGWEQVAVGSKKTGRVVKVLHDMGDRVAPGDILVELEKVDAELAVSQAESQYLAELVKLGISRQQAEDFVSRYGITEDLLRGELADQAIRAVPAVVERQVAMEKAATDLSRKRQLYQRGVGSKEELQNEEDAYRAAQAAYDNAIVVARTVVANAMTSRVALDVAKQNLADMTIIDPHRRPCRPRRTPARSSTRSRSACRRGPDAPGRARS